LHNELPPLSAGTLVVTLRHHSASSGREKSLGRDEELVGEPGSLGERETEKLWLF
jgi:hypothetical protein